MAHNAPTPRMALSCWEVAPSLSDPPFWKVVLSPSQDTTQQTSSTPKYSIDSIWKHHHAGALLSLGKGMTLNCNIFYASENTSQNKHKGNRRWIGLCHFLNNNKVPWIFLSFFFYLMNIFFTYFTYKPLFPLPSLLPFSPSYSHIPPSPSLLLPSPSPFKMDHASHGLEQSMEHQVEVELSLPHPCIKVGRGNPTWGTVYPNQLSARARFWSHC